MSSKQKQINYDIKEKKKARTPPHMHLSSTSSDMNNITPNVMLDALGLNPVIKMPWSGGATHYPRTSVLKLAIVEELEQFLFFSVLSQMCNLTVTIAKCLCTML